MTPTELLCRTVALIVLALGLSLVIGLGISEFILAGNDDTEDDGDL